MSVPLCISRDRAAASRAARRVSAQGILWMAAAEEYSRDRPDWQRPQTFRVAEPVIEAISKGWDMWNQAALPDHLAAIIPRLRATGAQAAV